MNLNDANIVIYGAGQKGRELLDILRECGLYHNVLGFIDKDEKKWGTKIEDKIILGILDNRYDNCIIVIAISSFRVDIESIFNDLSKIVKKENILYPLFLFHIYWKSAIGVLENKKANKSLTKEKKERFFAPYLKDDKYTQDILELFYSTHCGEKINLIPFFLQYEESKKFHKEHITNEFYWSEFIGYRNKFEKNKNYGGGGSVTIFDIGSHIGDSLGNFYFLFGDRIKKLYAFEPNPFYFEKSQEIKLLSQREEIILFNFGVGDTNSEAKINGMRINSNEDGTAIAVKRIDDLSLKIEGKLYMKLDVEGFEISAMKGAEEIIKTHKPNIAACVYHYIDDVWRIPEYLKSIVPEYNFVLRGGAHIVCYAFVDENG